MVERPREGMAHILYPQHEHVQFHGRSEDGLQSLPTWEADRQELLDRQRMRRASGWASDLREEYKPLGPPVELPPLGSQLRKKKNAAGSSYISTYPLWTIIYIQRPPGQPVRLA